MIFSSKKPLSLYLFTWGNLIFCAFIALKSNAISTSFIYGTIIFIFGYWYFLSGVYSIQLHKDHIVIKKIYKTNSYSFDKIIAFDYYRNFWHFFSMKESPSIVGNSYDTLFLEVIVDNKPVIIELHLNLLVFQFSKLIRILNKTVINNNIPIELINNAQIFDI